MGSCAASARRRRHSAPGGSGGPKDERRIGSVAASPQLDQPVDEPSASRDEVGRRQWRRVERLQGQNAVAASGRAESAGRAVRTRASTQRFVVRVQPRLTERAAQPAHLPPARRRRGASFHAVRQSALPNRKPEPLGHDDPSSRLVGASATATPVGRDAKIRIDPTLASIRSRHPGPSTS